MDGWYVATLLVNNETIRARLPISEIIYDETGEKANWFYLLTDETVEVPPDEFEFLFSEEVNLGEDVYNDLLLVEKKIKEMYRNNKFTSKEIATLLSILTGEFLKTSRRNFPPEILSICSKIAYFLGGAFTDDGFLDYLIGEYNLSEEEIIQVEKIILMNKILIL